MYSFTAIQKNSILEWRKGAYMYQVLARKYRPRNFNELVGQNHVSRALSNALERGRLHHAYLFTGTRGVGKTTIARILAKCLNCETGVTSTPCEVCATCKAVNEGRFIDLIEIDAASRTKVEDTRELLDNVPYAPTQGRFKVYLIDEVHMLSTHSFNALLKTLEEPPEHVKFLFATTDPQKLPITVISRCLQFTLRPLAVDEITSHLRTILTQEQIEADQDAIWQIAESAQGSLRDALSLTDQAIAYGQGAVHHQDVKEMLGLIDRTIIYDLILAIHQNHQARVSQLLLQFRQQALDVSMVLDQLVSTLHELALLQYIPDLALKYSEEINRKIVHLSQFISAQDLQLYYQIACKGRSDLQLAVTQEQGFEMCVLRLLAFRPLSADEITISQSNTQMNQPEIMPVISSGRESSNLQQLQHSPEMVEVIAQVTQEISHVETVSEPVLDNSQIMVFDVENEPLIGLDQSQQQSKESQNNQSNITDADDVLFFPVEENIQQKEQIHIEEQKVQQDDLIELDQPEVLTEILESVQAESVVEMPIEAASELQEAEKTELMPQDILKLQVQTLDGEWTLQKWEYWFRTSQLSAAVQELAQHGIMTGQIDGVSVLHITQDYEGMLSQLQHGLEEALKAQWSNTQFSVQYGALDSITPLNLKSARKERAFNRAVDLLQQEPTIQSLIQGFDASLVNIQLKL